MKQNKYLVALMAFVAVFVFAGAVANATHSWNGYHWARTSNPFTLKLGDNVSSAWDAILNTTSVDWSKSSVLDTAIVAGQGKASCRATKGRVEVCNRTYGNTGWLGVAQVWINSSNHIVQGTVKANDTYFNTPDYNTTAWRNLVMCQEIGHTLGLDHQDENFNNPNLGTCMDYTNDPASNQHPNDHDYDELAIIYAHTDNTNTATDGIGKGKLAKVGQDIDFDDPSDWGKAVKQDARGKNSLYKRDLGNGEKVFTFVIWAN